jgi:hypothetical protein
MVKELIRPDDLDHCHPSWFLIRKRAGRASDDLRSQLVSSPSGVAINKAFASTWGRISYNLTAGRRDMITNSRGVSVVVT